jgi:hypothetical protein
MDFQLKPGDKFCCIAFDKVAIDRSLGNAVDLGEGMWALPNHPFSLDHHWREWIGKIKAEQVDRCNFFLVAVKRSARPEVLDDENETLRKMVNRLLHGLLLQGIPNHVDGFVLTGAKVTSETHIRQYGEMKQFYNSNSRHRAGFTKSGCLKAKDFEAGYKNIEAGEDYLRVRLGMTALSRGMSEPLMQERMHEYVRSLEALAKTEIGRSEAQFIHRCQTFAVASDEVRSILNESYKIRSAVEHMNPVEGVYPGRALADIKHILGQRIRQIEALASSTYLRIATSAPHGQLFQTDAAISDFWCKPDHERNALWGKRLNIAEIK